MNKRAVVAGKEAENAVRILVDNKYNVAPMRQVIFPLTHGDFSMSFPDDLTPSDIGDMQRCFEIAIRAAERRGNDAMQIEKGSDDESE